MGEDRLPHKAYMMLHNLDARGKRNWVSNVRMQMFQYGFGFVWINQGVGRVNEFIRVFRERLIDGRIGKIMFKLVTDLACTEVLIAFRIVPKTYMSMDRRLKRIMTKFRFGVSELSVHYYRYRSHVEKDLKCPIYFFLCCPMLDDIIKHSFFS